MSNKGVTEFIERALTDTSLDALLNSEHEKVLGEYDLTKDEIAAILSGGEAFVKAMGVDERKTIRRTELLLDQELGPIQSSAP